MRASHADREQVAQVLNTALEEGRLTPAEASERLEQVYAARTLGELEPLTRDLPGHRQLVPPPFTRATSPAAPSFSGAPAAPVRRVGAAATSSGAVAIMSGTRRRGPWGVPAQFNAVALWGGVELDLTEASFATPTVTITAVAIMGGVEIVVPEDVTVVCSGIGIMGGFDDNARVQGPPGSPVVRVNGLAFWGAVEIKRAKPKAVGDGGKLSLEK